MTDQNSQPPVVAKGEEAPDPGEDDLDDLDEMLDEFSSTKVSESAKGGTDTGSKPSGAHPPAELKRREDHLQISAEDSGETEEDEFAKQLQAGVAEMMKEFESNPDMAKQFEQLMTGQFNAHSGVATQPPVATADNPTHLNSADPPDSSKAASSPGAANGQAPPSAATPSFQDTIRQTMDRMRDSNVSASAASSKSGDPSSEDFMTAMLNEIAQSQGGANGNSEDAFSNMLLGMMEQLTNKEILYEPMKELSSKFPAWLAEREPGQPKAHTLSDEDRKKYEGQQALVNEIVERFERAGYSDQNAQDREFVVERMQKMQAAGAPPADLVGDMGGAAEMLGDLDSQCPQQ